MRGKLQTTAAEHKCEMMGVVENSTEKKNTPQYKRRHESGH